MCGNFIGGYLSGCLPKKVGGFVTDLRENKEDVCYFFQALMSRQTLLLIMAF